MDHLREAKRQAERAIVTAGAYRMLVNATLAIAHVLIAICERLPRRAETGSERLARLREEENKDGI